MQAHPILSMKIRKLAFGKNLSQMDCSNDIILATKKKKKKKKEKAVSVKHSLEHTAYQEFISSESEGNNQGSVLEF